MNHRHTYTHAGMFRAALAFFMLAMILLFLMLPMMGHGQTVTVTNASGGTTTINGGSTNMTVPFTSPTDIIGGIGKVPGQVLNDGYMSLKNLSITNPIQGHVFGLMNGSGKYGGGIMVNQADPTKFVNAGFALAAVQTEQKQGDGTFRNKWSFYDASLNLSVQQTETIPLLKIPIVVTIFSGPFCSMNGGVLMGAQSGVSGDVNFLLSKHWAFTLGGGVVNCTGAAAAGLKPAMPMGQFALTWAPNGH